MKKYTRIFIILFTISIYSLIIEGCFCSETIRFIGDGETTAHDIDSLDRFAGIDTIQGPFTLLTWFETERTTGIDDFSMMNSAYAFTCDVEYANQLLIYTFKLSASKSFTYDNQPINAGEDFSKFLILLDATSDNVYPTKEHFAEHHEIEFLEEFINNASFNKEEYTFYISIKTDDELELQSEVTLFMDL